MTQASRKVGLGLPLLVFDAVLFPRKRGLLPEPKAGSEAPCLQAQDELGDFSSQTPSIMWFQERTESEDRHWLGAGTEGAV